jgi:hypothetical protein
MLWARGKVQLTGQPALLLQIGIRDVAPWQIEVLKTVRTGAKDVAGIVAHPSVAAYCSPPQNLASAQVERYLNSLTKLNIPIVKKTRAGWHRTGTRFDDFLREKEHDRDNYLQVRNQIQNLAVELQAQFGAAYGPGQEGPFHIARSALRIPLAPAIMNTITGAYSIPTSGSSVNLPFEMPQVPLSITNGQKQSQWDFLQGVADACGTLEGNTPRGVDARVKFDLLNNIQNLSVYRTTVEKVCGFCHFVQFNLGIPVQGTNVSKSNNARPHKPKIWVGDLRYSGFDPQQWPLWRIKVHYNQRLLSADRDYSARRSDFHPSQRDIAASLSYVRGHRQTYPSYCLNVNYCSRLQAELRKVPTLPGTDFVEALKRKLARDLRREGVVLP